VIKVGEMLISKCTIADFEGLQFEFLRLKFSVTGSPVLLLKTNVKI